MDNSNENSSLLKDDLCVHSDVKVEWACRRLSLMFILDTGLQEMRRRTGEAEGFLLTVRVGVDIEIDV